MVLDSVSEEGVRLTTLELKYPAVIHGEFMTHRVFSRNASSSRAIPLERMVENVRDDPFIPLVWQYNKRGMQGGTMMTATDRERALCIWENDLAYALHSAEAYIAMGDKMPHKQIPNRLLGPFMHMTTLVSSTSWENFMDLRDHPAAEPHMALLAQAIGNAIYSYIRPSKIPREGWHVPYINPDKDFAQAAIELLERDASLGEDAELLEYEIIKMLCKVSTARCARVSYNNHDGSEPKLIKDLALYDDLMSQAPLHASPAEHVAQADKRIGHTYERPDLWGNFHGWKQFRKMHALECSVDPNHK